jgi:hypothetical protein
MELSSSENYNYLNNINYLNINYADGEPFEKIKTNLKNILNNDTSLNVLLNDLEPSNNGYASSIDNYVKFRDVLDTPNNYSENIDKSVIQNILNQKILAEQNLEKKNQILKMIYNRKKQLNNEKKYNNIVIQGLDISDESQGEGVGLGEIPNLEKDIITLNTDIEEKKRNLEVNKYYEKKMKHQLDILKRLVFFLLILFLIGYLYKIGIISENKFVVLIGLGIALIILYAFYSVIDILMRDNLNYDEYKFIIFSDYYLNKGEPLNTKNKKMKFGIEYNLLPESCKSNN